MYFTAGAVCIYKNTYLICVVVFSFDLLLYYINICDDAKPQRCITFELYISTYYILSFQTDAIYLYVYTKGSVIARMPFTRT